jgi:adenine-specific DNA methylase
MTDDGGRTERPIERGFPIERVNEIAAKESRAKQWYRPIYTMHKWWARRPGCLFRAITLYSLLDENTDPEELAVYEPGENQTLGSNGHSATELLDAAADVDMDNPESLWEFYPKDVRLPEDTKVLDPFAGGGTSLVEASRFGVESEGYDLNPVAWFVTKKELEAGETDVEELERAFERVRDDVAGEIKQYYRTPCPNAENGGESDSDHAHDADVMYNFWVKELDCTSCGHTVSLFKDYRVAAGRYEDDDQYNVLCPDCGAVTLVDDWQAEESTCGACFATFDASAGHVTRGGYYNCPECGLKEGITDATVEQGKPDERLYAVEYYCETCDEAGEPKSVHKGYKRAEVADERLYRAAADEWDERTDLHEYVPSEEIPAGHETVDRRPLFDHGYTEWTDMFNERQLLSYAKILNSIERVEDENVREFLLLTVSDVLETNSTMVSYDHSYNKIDHVFKINALAPPTYPVENNLWGTAYGRGTFTAIYDMVKRAVEYADAPTDRHVTRDETVETAEFERSIGERSGVSRGDMRKIDARDEYDAVITDPPYYDNIIYSELSDYFYVWQKVLLEDEYEAFQYDKTPRAESIVTNPHLGKTAEDFEHEIGEALSVIRRALKDDGVLAFTYHHSDSESWGELLTSLCRNDFEITATYPISSDLNKFVGGDAVAFDIVIVARPTDDRQPTSWRALRRKIVRTARETRETLEKNRDLASGDIGVIEMGNCFQEYSKHHGKVHRAGEIMGAKEVVDQIYGIIQDADLGETDVYLDLLEQRSVTTDALNKLLRRADATRDRMEEMELLDTDATGLELRDWRDEDRQAHAKAAVENPDNTATTLDRAHLLRNVYEQGGSRREYLDEWDHDELQALCEDLARVTGDETYLRMLGADVTLDELGAD